MVSGRLSCRRSVLSYSRLLSRVSSLLPDTSDSHAEQFSSIGSGNKQHNLEQDVHSHCHESSGRETCPKIRQGCRFGCRVIVNLIVVHRGRHVAMARCFGVDRRDVRCTRTEYEYSSNRNRNLFTDRRTE